MRAAALLHSRLICEERWAPDGRKELFGSFSIFNPAASGWGAVVEGEGGACKKPTCKGSLYNVEVPPTSKTEGKIGGTVSVGWIQQLNGMEKEGLKN